MIGFNLAARVEVDDAALLPGRDPDMLEARDGDRDGDWLPPPPTFDRWRSGLRLFMVNCPPTCLYFFTLETAVGARLSRIASSSPIRSVVYGMQT